MSAPWQCLVTVAPLIVATGARYTVRAASANDRAITGLGGVVWEPCLTQAPSLALALFDGNFGNAIQPGAARLPLNMATLKESYDQADECDWSGAPVEIYAGRSGDAWPWTQVFKGTVTDYARQAQTLALAAEVDSEPFNADQLPATYAGTGGAEGGADLKNRVKPLVIGWAMNVEPVLIDATNNVYQFSSYGAIEAVSVLYERGSDFGSAVGDYASYAALVAATVPPGRWATCLAEGMVRLGAPAYGVITGDVKGHKVGSATPRLTGAIVQALASIAGVDSGLIETATLDALDAAVPYHANLVLTEQASFVDTARRLALPCNAQAGVSLVGTFFVARVDLTDTPAITLDAQGRALPQVADAAELKTSAPYARMIFGANRSWRVHSFDEIATYAELVDRGAYNGIETYREGNIAQNQGSSWLYINPTPTSGNAPPTLPTESNAYWQVLAKAGSDGVDGADGLSIAELTVFQRSVGAPATPTGGSYDFGAGTLTPPSGWSTTIPGGTNPLYAARGTAAIAGTSGSATPTWLGVGLLAENGADGLDGDDGVDGAGVDVVFIRSEGQPSTPSPSVGTPSGWYTDVNSVPAGPGFLWSSFGQRADSSSNYAWGAPAKIEGEAGGSFTPVLSSGMVRNANGGFTRTASTSTWDEQVFSQEKISGARVSWRALQTDAEQMVGLGIDPTANASFNTIDYAIYMYVDGYVRIYEDGTGKTTAVTPYTTSDVLSVEQRDEIVFYCKNSIPFYVSLIPQSAPMAIDSSFTADATGLADVVFGQAPPCPDLFEFGLQTLTKTGQNWQKASGATQWGDSAFMSVKGYAGAQITFEASSTDKQLMAGLSLSRRTGKSYADISCALYLVNDGTLRAYVDGTDFGAIGAGYASGDVFTVRHQDNEVHILQNGNLIYRFTGFSFSETTKFWAHASFYDVGGGINNVTFGQSGQNGSKPDLKFKRSASAPATPTGDSPAGWSDGVPSGNDPLWVIRATKNYAGVVTGAWSTPQLIAGQLSPVPYSGAATYYQYQTVTYGGGTYICAVPSTTGNAPSGTAEANTWWDVMAAPGEAGAPGTPPSGFTTTINLTSLTGLTNLRSIADAAGYPGGDATITFNVPNGVTLRGLSGANAVDSGTWPTGYSINLSLVVQSGGIVDGGGGDGGAGNYVDWTSTREEIVAGNGQAGGDAVYCRRNMSVTVDSGGVLRAGGGGGGGGARSVTKFTGPGFGGSGGGGAPNGDPNGTTSGGGAGAVGTGDGTGGTGGNGGGYGAAGSAASGGGSGGAAGYAVRKNGFTVTVTNNGTMTGTAA